MSKKHENPFRAGCAYEGVFNAIRESGNKGITRQELLNKGFSQYDITSMLSPRATSKRGDCRGNVAVHGNIWYVKPLKVGGVGKAHFRLVWRDPILPPLVPIKGEVKAKKVAKVKKTTPVTTPETAPVTTPETTPAVTA